MNGNEKNEQLYTIGYFLEIAGGDMDFIKKMLQLFINMMPGLVNEMTAAYERRDLQEMGRIAHKIKPNLDNMSIPLVTQTIREIEEMGKADNHSPQLPAMLAEIKTVVENVISQIGKDYPDL